MDERNRLVQELSYSYRLLTSFAREHAQEFHVDAAELNLLGRKLYAALERRPGKIECINPGISKDLVEKRLSLHLISRQDGGKSWFLYRGEVNEPTKENAKSLKTSSGLVEMLTWCHINQVTSRSTIISLHPNTCPIKIPELHALLDALRELYPLGQKPQAPLNALANAPYALSCTLFVNIGQDPLKHLAKVGKQLASDRCNPLSFGGTHANLLVNMEQLFTTSWGELLVVRHEGKEGLLESVCQYLQLTLKKPPNMPLPTVCARGFSSIRAGSIARRVEKIYEDLSRTFSHGNDGANSRYLLEIADDFFLIQQKENQFSWYEIGGLEELLEELSHPLTHYLMCFDRNIVISWMNKVHFLPNASSVLTSIICWYSSNAFLISYWVDATYSAPRPLASYPKPPFITGYQKIRMASGKWKSASQQSVKSPSTI